MIDSNKFLNPDTVKRNLILSGLYLVAYELLKDAITGTIKDFFSFGCSEDGKTMLNEQYKDEVTKVHKDLLFASCLWLRRNNVITESEVKEIENIRRHRNQVVHELPRLLSDTDLNLNTGYFLRIRELLKKVEVWWAKNVVIPANEDFDGVEVNEEDIQPGGVIVLDYIISAAIADYNEGVISEGRPNMH